MLSYECAKKGRPNRSKVAAACCGGGIVMHELAQVGRPDQTNNIGLGTYVQRKT